jgi:hypothetical protein
MQKIKTCPTPSLTGKVKKAFTCTCQKKLLAQICAEHF